MSFLPMSGCFLGRKIWPDYAGCNINQDLVFIFHEDDILEHWLRMKKNHNLLESASETGFFQCLDFQ